MIAPRVSLLTLLRLDPALGVLPSALRSELVAGETVAAGPAGATAGEVAAGDYVVASAGGVPLRSSPSALSSAIALLDDGAEVHATGETNNYFAAVDSSAGAGWVSAQFLAPAGAAALSALDILEARALLIAWAKSSNGLSDYGQPYDLIGGPAADERLSQAVGAFQQARRLPRSEVLDAATVAALASWASERASEAIAAVGGTVGAGVDPAVGSALTGPGRSPVVAAPVVAAPAAPASSGFRLSPAAKSMALLAGVAVLAFFLLEGKKKGDSSGVAS